ncbi:MAG: MFS transporter, partial [Alphaproteobacteria bacterium]
MTRDRLTVLTFASIGHLFTHMMMLIYATVVLRLETAWQMDYGTLVTLASTGWLLFGLGALPAGWLADRWTAPGMMAVLFFGLGGASVATGFADSPTEMAIGLAAIGLFAAIYHPVGIPWLLRHGGDRKGLSIGINGFFGAVGIAFAPLVAVACADAFGWRWAFFIPGGTLIAFGVLHVMLSPRDIPVEADRAGAKPTRLRDPAVLRLMLALMVIAFSAGLIFHGTSVAMPKMFEGGTREFAVALMGANAVDTSLFVTALYLIAGCCQILVGGLADRMPKRTMFMTAYLLQIPVLAVLGWLSGAPMVGVALLAVVLSLGFQTVEDLLVVRSVPSSWLSRVFATRFVVGMGAGVLAPLLVGFGYDWTGNFGGVFLVFAAVAAIVVLAASQLPSDRSARASAAVPAE